MALFDDINKANAELEKLRTAYKDLTGKEAPMFNVKNIEQANSAVEAMNKSLKQTRKEIDDLENGFGGVYDQIKGILGELSKGSTPTKSITKEFRSQERIVRKLKDDQAGINKLSLSELKTLQSKQRSSAEEINISAKQIIASQNLENLSGKALDLKIEQLIKDKKLTEEGAAMVRGYKEGFTVLSETDKLIEKRIAKEEKLNKAMGVTGALIGGIKGTLDALGMGGLANVLNLEQAKKDMRKVAEEIEDAGGDASSLGSQFKIMGAGISGMAEGIATAISDPLVVSTAILGKLVSAFKHLDEDTGNIAKNMNMTYDEALALTGELKAQAKASNDVFVTTAGMTESMLAVNDALGISVKLTAQQAAEFTSLREQAGFTNEELVGINALSATTGKGMKEITGEFMAQARLKGQELGVALNEKDLLKEIGQISAATTLSFGKNPSLIAEAVAATKALGLEMDKVDAIADSLLNFEQSISNEMEAELLLGKNLNLEKARQAALDNDLATLAEEIAKNVGDSAEFAQMNRIQQEAAANAVGMNREELAKMLFTQEQLTGLSEEETALREKQINDLQAKGLSQAEIKAELENTSLAQLEEQASISDRMNASMEKLNEAFGSIAITVMPFFSGMASAAAALAEMPIVAGILVGVLGGLAAMSAVVAISNTIAAATAIMGSFAKIPFGIGIPLGFAAIGGLIGIISSIKSTAKADDLVSPGGSGGGYGSRMLKGPEGVISLNNKDTVIAGTNLFSKGDDVMSAPAGAIALGNQDSGKADRTNQLLTQMVGFQKKQPGFSRVSLYEVQ